jgi:Ca2+-binding EF-hand superfamily protein
MRAHYTGLVAAAALCAIGSLPAQDEADLFSKLDANKDGFVTADEVQESQKALFERLLRNADKDGDKKLSKEEFQAGLKPDESPKQPLTGGQNSPGRPGGGQFSPQDVFNRLDVNKDGKLSKDELPERMRENFSRIDANGDGSVSPEEFRTTGFGQRPPGTPGNLVAGGDAARRAAEGFDQADANKDGKLTKDELPENRRDGFEQLVQRLNPGGDQHSITKEQYIRGMVLMSQAGGAPGARPANAANEASPEVFSALFDRTDSNSDGKLTKDEIPEERRVMRAVLERSGGDSISKESFVRGMMAAMAQGAGQPARPEAAPRPEGAPTRRPEGPPGPPPGGLFAMLDTDHDGQLSTSEIVGAGTALLKLDRNGDGKLTPEEVFGPGGGPPSGRPTEGRPPETRPGAARPGSGLLEALDTNKDGKISKEEAASSRLRDRFDQLDTNGDGFIDQAEGRQMLERMQKAGGKAPGRRPNPDNK